MRRPMLEKVASVEEGVKVIFSAIEQQAPDFKLKRRDENEFSDILTLDEKEYPIFAERYEVRIRKISDYGKDPTQNSAVNVYSFTGCDISLDEHIFRELSIAEHILNAKIVKITAFVNKNAANIIALTDHKTTANLDLANSLAAGSEKQCQHKLITTHGMANDIAVGTMTAVNQINVFKTESKLPETYDDDEYYLYGLDDTDVARVNAIYSVMTGKTNKAELSESYERLKAAVKAVHISSEEERPVYIKEVMA